MKNQSVTNISNIQPLTQTDNQRSLYEVIENENYKDINFSGHILSGTLFNLSNFKNSKLLDCQLFGFQMKNCSFIGVTFKNCIFEFGQIKNCEFISCRFKNCKWEFSTLKSCNLNYCFLDKKSLKAIEGENSNEFESCMTDSAALRMRDQKVQARHEKHSETLELHNCFKDKRAA